MMLVEETTVPLSALPVTQFKDHLRLGSGFADDAIQDGMLESFLRAAMAAIEARTGKILIEREFSWTLTLWRDCQSQALPVAPVSAVIEMVMINNARDETVADAGSYRLVPDMQRPRIEAVGGVLSPVPSGGSVRIGLLAGFGPDWADLPADLGQAVLMLAAHFYEYRHEAALGGGAMPYSVNALIERYRTVRVFGGGRR
ncbi:head-tail connector protein [Aestuariibius sp. HNIBRBA575]|uniref:head-tail connector protein n=1 Tax=Aestuariibius sp. HNIBRBA575 TaxID=3233343 RepID=UPI0034A13988